MDTLSISGQLKKASAVLATARVLARDQGNELLTALNSRYVARPLIQRAFKYVPFEDPANEIRLLRIRFISDEERIVGHLETHAANAVPSYVALSYTWGDSTPRTAIRLDDCSFSVGLNCYHALRSVCKWWRRRQNKQPVGVISEILQATKVKQPPDLRVWVDAICIDQSNLEEKSHQVQKMGAIFMEARTVCAWTGHSDRSSSDFFEACYEHRPAGIPRSELHDYVAGISNLITGTRVFFTTDNNNIQDTDDPRYDYWDPFQSASKRDTIRLPTLENAIVDYHDFQACLRFVETSKLVSAIPVLLRRAYFSRLWIIQELAFSRLKSSVVVLCGDDDSIDIETQEMFILEVLWGLRAGIEWQRARNALIKQTDQQGKVVTSGLRFVDSADIDTVSAWIASVTSTHGFILLHHTRDFDKEYVAATLRELVFQYRDWGCADPRDRVYGLLHLAAYTAHAKHQRIRQAQAAVRRRPLPGFLEPFETCTQCREDVPVSVNYGRSTFDLAVILCEYTYHPRANLFDHMNAIAKLLELTTDAANVESIRARFAPKSASQVEQMRTSITNAHYTGSFNQKRKPQLLTASFHLALSRHKSGQLCTYFLPFGRDADILLDTGNVDPNHDLLPTSQDEIGIFVGQSRFLCATAGALAREGDILLVFSQHNVRFAVIVRPDQKARYALVTHALLSMEMFNLMNACEPRFRICHEHNPAVCGRGRSTPRGRRPDKPRICGQTFEMLFGYHELFLLVTCLGSLTLEEATDAGSRSNLAKAFASTTLASYAWVSGQPAKIPPSMYAISHSLSGSTDVSTQKPISINEWLHDSKYFWTVDRQDQESTKHVTQDSFWLIPENLATQESLKADPEFIDFQKREDGASKFFPSQEVVEKHSELHPAGRTRKTFTQWLRCRDRLVTELPSYSSVPIDQSASFHELDAQSPSQRYRARSASCATQSAVVGSPRPDTRAIELAA